MIAAATTQALDSNISRATIIRSEQGCAYWALTDRLNFFLGSKDTGGAFTFAEATIPPDGGPPPHTHRREDELIYVLEGEFLFTVGDYAFTRAGGSALWLPRGVRHSFRNIGSRPGRLLMLAHPGGFESFVAAFGHPITDPCAPMPRVTPHDIHRLKGAAERFDIAIRPDARAIPSYTPAPLDRSLCVLGQFVKIKLASEDTTGHYSVAEITSPSQTGVPPHLHREMDELFYVIDGMFEFMLGDRLEHVGRRSTVFIPRGIPHGFRNVGDRPGRLFDVHTPGGFEKFFEEAGVMAADPNRLPQVQPLDTNRIRDVTRKQAREMSVA